MAPRARRSSPDADVSSIVGRLSAYTSIVTMSMCVAGATAIGVNATTVNWEAPSFAILKVELLLCRMESSWDHECQIRRSDAQHAFDAVWSCIKDESPAARCTQVKREFFAQGSELLATAEIAALPGHRSVPFAASNPWLAGSIEQWKTPAIWSDPHVGLLVIAALAVASTLAAGAYGRWSVHNARVSQSAERLSDQRRRHAALPSAISSEQKKVDWFDAFFKLIDSGLASLPNKMIPLSLPDTDPTQLESTTTTALSALLGEDSFRGKGRAERVSKRTKKSAVVWMDRTERRKQDHRLIDEQMVLDFVPVPITMRIKLRFMWLGNPGCMSRYQWDVEATFHGIEEGLVRTCPNQSGTKCLTWCAEFDFAAWDGDGEAEGRLRAMAWLTDALQRKTLISQGTAATKPYARSVNEVAWLKRQLSELPQIIEKAEADLNRLQAGGFWRRATGFF